MLALILVVLSGLVSLSTAGYVLEDDYSADKFFSMFDFFTDSDPTHGFVQYVDQGTAQGAGLIGTNNGAIYMGVDSTNVASSAGRTSVRITSKKSYNHGLIILDLAHMPGGQCGTWPAFWTVGPNWPNAGEVDIIEGVNSQVGNSMALHTTSGCSISNNGMFSGSISTPNCDVNAAGQATNAGCAILTSNSASYGTGFNQQQGGVYATEWTSDHISIWFFSRSAIPSDITSGNPDPSGWGNPTALFTGSCDIDHYFSNQQIVFDTTFCGDWAGNVWSSDPVCGSKASTCQSFVQNNPSAFKDAYWSVNSLKVYQGPGGSGATYSQPPHGPPGSASASLPVYSGPSGAPAPPVIPTAGPESQLPPTTDFSRGGNGRHTRTWGDGWSWGAKFASASATDVAPAATSSAPPVLDGQFYANTNAPAAEWSSSTPTPAPVVNAAATSSNATPPVTTAPPVNNVAAVPSVTDTGVQFVTVSALEWEDVSKKRDVSAMELDTSQPEKRNPSPEPEPAPKVDEHHLQSHVHAHFHRHLMHSPVRGLSRKIKQK